MIIPARRMCRRVLAERLEQTKERGATAAATTALRGVRNSVDLGGIENVVLPVSVNYNNFPY